MIVAQIASDARYLAAYGLSPAELACAAPLDTEGFDVPAVAAGSDQQALIYRNAFGSDPPDWEAASPLRQVGGTEPTPDWFLAKRGTAARRALAESFAAAVRDAGATTTVVDVTGYSHEDVSRRLGEPGETRLTPPFAAFLDACVAVPAD